MAGMTMGQRMLAVLEGREHDRVPFAQCDGMAAPNEDIWAVVGRERMGILVWTQCWRRRTRECVWRDIPARIGGRPGMRTVLETPEGPLTQEMQITPTYGVGHRTKYFIRRPKDYRALRAYLRDVAITPDLSRYPSHAQMAAENGLLLVPLGRTPWQRLWMDWVHIGDLAWHVKECGDIVEECVRLMADDQLDTLRVVRDLPREARLPVVMFLDSVTSPMIGEERFRRYCLPLYRECAEMMSERGSRVFVHMDGELKPLLGAIADSAIHGVDSFSPPPDNQASLADAARAWPDKRLWVNFPSSVHLASPETVYERARIILEEAGHTGRLQLQISENVPPGLWRKSFPEIIRAIEDFGPP